MPLYAYACEFCGLYRDEFRHVDQRHDARPCQCGQLMRLEIRAPMVQPDLPGYHSPVSGKWIEGRTARREDLARTGSRPWEGMEQEKREAARQRAHDEAKADAKLDAAARTAFHQLSPTKRAELANSGPVD